MRRRVGLLLPLLVSASLVARAEGPLLHEYISPNAAEDLELAATTQDGAMPAALETGSGIVSAPGEARQDRAQHAYGGNATPDSIDSSFRIDRDTTRPSHVAYDEPFTPAVAPFKRLYAYDGVDENFELVVHDKELTRLDSGGRAAPEDDQFYGDLFVDLASGVPVRIPSVGPGARVLVARTDPAVPFRLERDTADNWFMVGDARRRVRLLMQLSIERSVFGGDLGNTSWGELLPLLPPLPSVVKSAATEVLQQIGVSQALSPADATRMLVGYFRSFAPSDAAPEATRGRALYRALSLSRKGVCRHRAYAFVVTALGLGLPARMVRNEAHAWVEVADGSARFHRIDLGGAAGRMDFDARVGEHLYRPPPDPYVWPKDAESAAAMLGATLQGGSAPSPAAPLASAASSGPPRAPKRESIRPPDATAAAPSAPPSNDERPATGVTVTVDSSSAKRGAVLEVQGLAAAAGKPCPSSRVDVSLRDGVGVETWLGAFPTDEGGHFEGRVTVPFEIDVGEYTLTARTPGAGRCGSSE